MVHLLPPDPKIALGCAHLKSAAKGQCLRRHSDCKHAERSSNGDGLLLAIPLGTHEPIVAVMRGTTGRERAHSRIARFQTTV